MHLTFHVEESALGWRVRHGVVDLVEGLALGKAIKCARRLGRDLHERTGCPVTVELIIPEKSLLLAQYASPDLGDLRNLPNQPTGARMIQFEPGVARGSRE
ncbi:MAG: hypothetical protein ACTHL5_10720 [Rhodanobacter sp.]